jgi:hypothetical protein
MVLNGTIVSPVVYDIIVTHKRHKYTLFNIIFGIIDLREGDLISVHQPPVQSPTVALSYLQSISSLSICLSSIPSLSVPLVD